MKKTESTFERIMEDPKQKESFEKEYANFLLSELLLDALLSSLGYELVARKGRRCVSLTKQSA